MAPPTSNPTVRVSAPKDHPWPTKNEDVQAEYKKLRKGYAGEDAINYLTLQKDQERQLCEVLVKDLFSLIDVDVNDHFACFTACVDKCVATKVVRATLWSTWGGYRDFTVKLKEIAARTTYFKTYYIMPAPTVVAAAAVKKLRNVDTDGRDDTTALIDGCKVFEFAAASVEVWHSGQKANIRTNHPYNGAKLVDDKALAALTGNTQLETDDDDVEFVRTSELAETRNRLPAMHVTMQLDQPWATMRSPSPEPPLMREVKYTLRRDEVVGQLKDLIRTATSKNWTEDGNRLLVKLLTKEKIAVLPKDLKMMVGIFAGIKKNEEIAQWVDECPEDQSTIQWTVEEEIPRPSQWAKTGCAMDDVLKDWDNWSNSADKIDGKMRRKIKQSIEVVRYNYREQELNATRQAQSKALSSVKQLSATMDKGFQDIKTHVNKAVRQALDRQARSFVKILREEGIINENGKRPATDNDDESDEHIDDEDDGGDDDDEHDTHHDGAIDGQDSD
ncbi:hypothetical protein J3E68DRAFT_445180 [Trichoderma sp. SZMC 28012]